MRNITLNNFLCALTFFRSFHYFPFTCIFSFNFSSSSLFFFLPLSPFFSSTIFTPRPWLRIYKMNNFVSGNCTKPCLTVAFGVPASKQTNTTICGHHADPIHPPPVRLHNVELTVRREGERLWRGQRGKGGKRRKVVGLGPRAVERPTSYDLRIKKQGWGYVRIFCKDSNS